MVSLKVWMMGSRNWGLSGIPFVVPLIEKSEVELLDEWFSPIGKNFTEL
jgi:hypothetical protein